MNKKLAIGGLTIMAAVLGFGQAAAQTAAIVNARKTVLEGAYSAAQATRGQAGYTANCGRCHGGDLAGVSAPALKGDKFMERWRDDSLDSLFEYIRTAMPKGRRPESQAIPDDVYLDLYTYILQQNAYPPGAEELTKDKLGNIQLVGKDGPKPVPDGSVVVIVGCFVQSIKGDWILVNATEPIRTRKPDKTTPEELAAAGTTTLGNKIFLVRDIEAVADFIPEAHKGERMQAKGFLVRQPNAERINLVSIETAAPTCGQ